MMYGFSDTECDGQIGLSFWIISGHFKHLLFPNNPKNQNFRNMEKPHGYIISLHNCTINDDHMIYGF